MKKTLTLLTLSFSLFTNLSAYEIIIDKTLKVKQEKAKSSYTYPALQRDDTKEIVYDPSSKLIWQDNSAAKSTKRDWEGAKSYCRDLSFASFSDWRLPTIKELESISDYSRYPNAYKKGFKNFTSSSYWSSSPDVSNSSDAWLVYFKSGYSDYDGKSSKGYVRCARAGQ
ncbi:MAG: DUF1566 domain-containing protein [Campylobacterota bacterium]|nr:DUF1566 domain-containing protein [Campylobacterota bacterium]